MEKIYKDKESFINAFSKTYNVNPNEVSRKFKFVNKTSKQEIHIVSTTTTGVWFLTKNNNIHCYIGLTTAKVLDRICEETGKLIMKEVQTLESSTESFGNSHIKTKQDKTTEIDIRRTELDDYIS